MDRPSAAEHIGHEAMALADRLLELYGPDVTVGAVAIVVDVIADGLDGSAVNPIIYSCSDPRRWLQVALLDEALQLAQEANEARIEASE